ncbi:DNA polymerase III subunit delta [Lottiidibacillus patelloidae]|uniref:DNA polymerase III subunit delta n=1 Tax=Lottiidibacillus patelloidae TaxID=2670334 RepID=A0A263BVI4_9BACI|nr:DNA polymerase III subunit delta [Lottiidibacillus patelloidae]OZM57763.1 DNA polymerase III subunit delta [Lottiidibacillus patelloidae]
MAQDDIHKKISQNNFAHMYLLYGKETFLMEEIEQEIIKKTLSDDVIDFNLAVYDMEEVPIDIAIEDAETLPFMGEKRVVIVKNASFLTAAKQKIEHDLTKFLTYIENPSPSTIIIIQAPYEKLDERKKIVKLLKKQSDVLEANQLNETMIKKWVQSRAKSFSVSISDRAIEKLLLVSGANLMLLASEIEKLALFAGDGGEITEEIVEEQVARTLEQNIFTLIDKVTHRKIDEAFRILYDLLKQKEEPIKIVSLLARQFRIIYQVKQLTQKGYGQKNIASMIKVHPFAVKLAGEQSRRFSDHELLTIIDRLAEADFQMKSGAMDKRLILDLFLTKLKETV